MAKAHPCIRDPFVVSLKHGGQLGRHHGVAHRTTLCLEVRSCLEIGDYNTKLLHMGPKLNYAFGYTYT